ncbi:MULTISPECIES: PQQ-binding-like beta-propeller repeat protein [unclassified Streptomyces]|uniref:outer membrane protein assembly factor BamB family protein n=1 Tax=unclassified Streptomyces TaxID=2593676 RepID=UPI0036EA6B87
MAAAAVVGVVPAVLLPGLLKGNGTADGDAGGKGGGTAQPSASASAAARNAAGAVVIPGADSGHTGDFGAVAADLSTRPDGWNAWRTTIADGPVDCVLADASLVCGGPRRITVLDAANGKQRWQTPPGEAASGPASVAAVIGTTVCAFQDGFLVALGLADGAEQWREPLPDGVRVADSVESGGVLHYATKNTGTGAARVLARELTGGHALKWDEPWSDPAADAELAFADGRLVAVGDGITVLKGADGARLGSIGARDIACRTPVLTGKLLLCPGSDGLTVVEVTAPQNRRTIAAGVDIAYRPSFSRDGKVVVSSRTQTYAFALADGRQYWASYDGGEDMQTMGGTAVVGDKVFVVGEAGVDVLDLAAVGEADAAGDPMTGWPEARDHPFDPADVSLVAQGDVLFLGFPDGTVLSGFAP